MRYVDKSKAFEILESESTTNIKDIANGDNGVIQFEAILVDCNNRSRNGVAFTQVELEEAIGEGHIVEALAHKKLYMEYNHPDVSVNKRALFEINPQNACARIVKIYFEDNRMMGTIETLPYGFGINLKKSIINGSTPSFSFRGIRTKDGKVRMVTVDHVTVPSARTAHGNISNAVVKVNGAEVQREVNFMEAFNSEGLLENGYMLSTFANNESFLCEALGLDIESIVFDKDGIPVGGFSKGGIKQKRDMRIALNKHILESIMK